MLLTYLFLFLVQVSLTIWFYISGTHDSITNYFYNVLITSFVIIPFVQGFFYIKRHPDLKKIIVPLQISNLFFASALYTWFYFNVAGREIPFPSFADVLFLLYYPANLISLYFLSKITQVKWTLSTYINFTLIFLIFSAISILFLSSESIDYTAPIMVIALNLIYPICDSLLVAMGITILRSQTSFGYRYLFFYVFGYVFMSFGDVIFAHQTNIQEYWNGNLVDLLYSAAHLSIALGTYFLPAIAKNNSGVIPVTPKPAVSQNI